MSRNKDRTGNTGASHDTPMIPAAQTASDNGFSFVVPTDFVDLPSKGKFYPENHPLYNAESIELRQMTAKEEDLLTSKTLLKKGIAIDRLLESLIIDKRVKADSLLVGDRNALVIAIRISGYGAEYTTKVTCPSCEHAQKKTFDLITTKSQNYSDLSVLDIAANDDGTFTTELPKTKLNIKFRLLTGKHEKALLSGMKMDRQQNKHEKTVTRHLRNMVCSVNDNSTSEALNYLIQNIPSMDSRHLRLAYKAASPNVELKDMFVCESCDFDQVMEVPLTADFFWPDR